MNERTSTFLSPATPDILTPMEAAEVLKIGRTTMYELLRTGEVKSIKVGRKIIVPKKFIEDFIENCAKVCYTVDVQMVGNLSCCGKE